MGSKDQLEFPLMGSKDESVIPVLNSMDQSELPPLFVKLSFDKSSLAQAIWQVWSLIEMINRSFSSGEEGWFEKKQLDVKKVENEKATWNYYLQCWLEVETETLRSSMAAHMEKRVSKAPTQTSLITYFHSLRKKECYLVTQNPLLSNSFRGQSHSENGALAAFCLKWKMHLVTPLSFLDHIIRRLGLKNNLHWEFLRRPPPHCGRPCSDLNADLPYTILPATLGDMLSIISEPVQPLTSAPSPSLNIADIVDPPLPAVANGSTPDDTEFDFRSSPTGARPVLAPSSSDKTNIANIGVSIVAAMLLCLLST
ncbi:hypothetical protein Patl1_14745 [Pistacia atlantica]|uniref:Uncharacterized protein n=1 Tax=Pistacia atlantica TaxID=434234 RepID=A0ACC1AX48_9ROSI|nr:hypothetical protein Patl1_14745 [Pistacia atlantica]